jgi:hypothetical protein
VFRVSHFSLLEVASLKFKFNSQNISEFDFIKIIEISTQVTSIFSKFQQNKKLIYAKTIHVLWYALTMMILTKK